MKKSLLLFLATLTLSFTAQAAVVAATVGAIAKITYDVISIFKTLTK